MRRSGVVLTLNWVVLIGVVSHQLLQAAVWGLLGCAPESDSASEDTFPRWSLAPPGPVCEVRVASGVHLDGPTWYPVVVLALTIANIVWLGGLRKNGQPGIRAR